MKKLKIPNYSFLILTPYTESDINKIQSICKDLGYELTQKECMHLWTIYSEASYEDSLAITKNTVQRAITYIEKGVIWGANYN